MDIPVIVNIILSILSFFLAVTSIVIVVITLQQNSKMIESSTRPIMSVYTQTVIINQPITYLIVRNNGNSSAYMKKFDVDTDFTGCYFVQNNQNYIEEFSKCVFAPNQSRVCALDVEKLDKIVHFTLEYSSCIKTYKEEYDINLKAATGVPQTRHSSKSDPLSIISLTLQDILFKNL